MQPQFYNFTRIALCFFLFSAAGTLIGAEKRQLLLFGDPCPLSRLIAKPAGLEYQSNEQVLSWVEQRAHDHRQVEFMMYSSWDRKDIWVKGTIIDVASEGSKKEGFNVRSFFLEETDSKTGKLRKRGPIDYAIVRRDTVRYY